MNNTLLALAFALAAPLTAHASESNGISYNSVELDYVYRHEANGDDAGGSIRGSFELSDNFFLFGGYGRMSPRSDSGVWTNPDDRPDAVEHAFSLGLGFNRAIGPSADWVTKLAVIQTRQQPSYECRLASCIAPFFQATSDDVDVALSTGVLGNLSEKVEAHAYIGYKTTGGASHQGTGAFAEMGGAYKFSAMWRLTGAANLDEGDTTYQAGIRADF